MSPPDTTARSLPPGDSGGRNDSASSETAQAILHAMPSAGSEPLALNALYHTLGEHLVQMLHETLDTHVAMTLTQLMPQVLETVRDVVRAQMPDLLAVLLQREIDQLKQAVEQEQREA